MCLLSTLCVITVVNDRQSVYGGLRGFNVRESAQNGTRDKVKYIRGYKSRKIGSHSFVTFIQPQQQAMANAAPRKILKKTRPLEEMVHGVLESNEDES